ncbi:ribulokinase [Aureibacillus halotolerans]|uniref:Ribulokinase n=1 Tax=Aureibacillus halotolerans TaxID=1508390 RepID=A0A4R6U860_9BACI|nr:ribulokinase [Aureibacillus halotolerans]TDQ42750.1 L-ribulokinase [Aureibacillus halotolerans]
MTYTIGVDYGTLSGRAVLVDVTNGREVGSELLAYPHGVMDSTLPDGTALGHDVALQHPQDYLDVLSHTIPKLLQKTEVSAEDVIGLGIDFTACTILPVDDHGKPLCFYEEHASRSHSYVKLWKHHAAQDKANQLNDVAEQRGEVFLQRYGGKISSEWFFPKIWELAEEAPDLYDQMDVMVEATDWVIWQLTGTLTRNACTAGYKAIWHKQEGFPSEEFLKALSPKLVNAVSEKLRGPILPIGEKAGELTPEMAEKIGLSPGIAIAVGNVDAHVSVPAVGITEPGKMLAIIGTSTCHILLGTEEQIVPGMCGVVEDGVLPGLYGYEAGQSCVGDHFNWVVETCTPASYFEEAALEGIDIHELLTKKAAALAPGESGLLALDWWNGNRSTLVDVDLTGMILGMTLQTKPEEIYRALIEATAFGTRTIIEAFRTSNVPVDEFYAAGGIAEKNALAMQIYADVLNMEIKISASSQTPALGAAMFGAVAAGKDGGGYENIHNAAAAMGKTKPDPYQPHASAVDVYDALYKEYSSLYDYFGRGENDVMKRLKHLKSKSTPVHV